MAMQLVKKPLLYDVIVSPNLYGDILSDLCAGLVGGLGLAPGANIGDELAVFEPTHGSAPKHAGKNRINPISMILFLKAPRPLTLTITALSLFFNSDKFTDTNKILIYLQK